MPTDWVAISAIVTSLGVIVALGFGIYNAKQTNDFRKRDAKIRGLERIVDWALEVQAAGTSQEYGAGAPYKIENRIKLKNRYQTLLSKGNFIHGLGKEYGYQQEIANLHGAIVIIWYFLSRRVGENNKIIEGQLIDNFDLIIKIAQHAYDDCTTATYETDNYGNQIGLSEAIDKLGEAYAKDLSKAYHELTDKIAKDLANK